MYFGCDARKMCCLAFNAGGTKTCSQTVLCFRRERTALGGVAGFLFVPSPQVLFAHALSGGSAVALLHASFVLGLLVAVMGFLVLRSRVPPVAAASVDALAGIVATSARTLDSGAASHLATYNRWGWALLMVVLCMVLVPRRATASRRVFWVEAAVGALLLLGLAGVKITYLGLGWGFVALAALFIPENRRLAVAVGALSVAAVVALLALELPRAYVGDLLETMRAGTTTERSLFRSLPTNLPWLGLVVVLLVGIPRRIVWGRVIAGVAAFGGTVIVASQSHDLAISLMYPLAVAAAALALGGSSPGTARPLAGPLAGCVVALLWCLLWGQELGTAFGHFIASRSDTLSQPLSTDPSGRLASIRVTTAPSTDHPDALEVAQAIAAGPPEARSFPGGNIGPVMQLMYTDLAAGLDALDDPDARVFDLRMTNLLSWAFNREPPRWARAWYDEGRTFGPASPITERELMDVDVVVGGCGVSYSRESILPMLEGWERRDLHFWTLYIRPDRAVGPK